MECRSVVFRNYVAEDLTSCGNLAREAWPFPLGITANVRMDEVIEIWIESTVASSSWAEVAVDELGIVGLLFGKVKGQPALKEQRSSLRITLKMIPKALSGSYGNILMSLRLMASFLTTEMKLLANSPRTDAEILMLIVGEAHRGKGLGKELVDRFVEIARKQNARSLSVYTEDQSSNWRFYEAYGFKQVARFYDNGSSRYAGKRSNALIYRLDI